MTAGKKMKKQDEKIVMLTGRYARYDIPAGFSGVELDLGCGKGGFLLELARRHPQRLILGADVMLGRIRKVSRKAARMGVTNIALLRVNAWDLMAYGLPDASLDRVHVLCPDPWPKARHAHRRLLCSEFLGRLIAKLKPGGILHLATDDRPYFAFMKQALQGLPYQSAPTSVIADVQDIKTEFQLRFEASGITLCRHLLQRAEGAGHAS